MADPPADAQGSKCRLLELPGELRNKIYRFCAVEDEPIHMVKAVIETLASGTLKNPPDVPPLAFTCKIIRHELLAIWPGENTFCVKVPDGMIRGATLASRKILKWKKTLGDMSRHLRCVEFKIHKTLLWYGTASLQHDAEVLLAVESRDRDNGTTQQFCKCDLQRLATRLKRRGMDGGRLIKVVRAFGDWYTYQSTGVDCNRCQLPLMV